jgi:homocysteine S-methyltransferase
MGVTILDGGVGEALLARAGAGDGPLWATRAMMDHPDLLGEVHRAFFEAGAQIASTNTYALFRDRLAPYGLDDLFAPLHRVALDQARRARDAHGAGLVAGSIGPLGASYRADLHPDPETATPLYAEKLGLMVPGVDLILCETVASRRQAQAVLDAAGGCGVPVWLSVTVRDDDGTRLRSGEAVADLLPLAEGRVAALLANCSAPAAMPAALSVLGRAGLPTGAYANGFLLSTDAFLAGTATGPGGHISPEAYADHAAAWAAQGATLIGGCCAVGPAHIAAVVARLRREGVLGD